MSENSVKEKSLNLSKENKIKFNLSSLIRIKDLYQLFEEEIKDDDYDYAQRFKNGSTLLTEFSDYVFNHVFMGNELNYSDIERFNNLDQLAPEDDEYSSYQAAIAVNIVMIATNIIKIVKGEESKIKSTIDYTLDVINNLKSEEFFTDNPDGDDEESEEYLEQFYDNEIAAEDRLIDSIDNISQNDFIAFNEENMIS
ncbi:hypothetical protein J2786_000624 [Chryseobacterium vietnamense]|uniref:Uncharacterized protein n=1 Tax=Chryseobacterium vietnamense TaxID=866785 RepID=A0ACC6J3C7_9FLAO|nr:hypothetical protein [Chryseobacterium vietnamense]MDR6457531.1 hypothetical protein [Chryseobacterium vietnamense]